MPHFLVKSENFIDGSIVLTEPNLLAHLAGALRVRVNETIKLIDENGDVHFCEIVEVSKKMLAARVLKVEKSNRFLPFKLNLIQSVLKNDAQSLLIENAVQLGVSEISPVIADNSTTKLSVAKTKTQKWQQAANEAFKQCERANLAIVHDPQTLKDFLKGGVKNLIVFAEKTPNTTLKAALEKIDPGSEINVLVGPEGGFSEAEFEFFTTCGFSLVSLGNLILKAPNATTAGLSNIIYEVMR